MRTTLIAGLRVGRALSTRVIRMVGLRWRLIPCLARVSLMFMVQDLHNLRHVEGV